MKNILILSVFCLMGTGCGFLDVEPKVIVADTFYTSEERAFSGLIGVYGGLGRTLTYGRYYSMALSNIDDLCYYRSSTGTLTEAYYLGHNASTTSIYNAWTGFYSVIETANLFMKAMEDLEFVYDPDHKYYNEARFLRAYCHFILAQGWGDVPLRAVGVTSAYDVSCPATSQYEILKWVVSEMEDCLELADETWECSSRVTKTIMWGILARVYLFMAGETVSGNETYRKDYYHEAMFYAKEVIDSGIHSLNPSYSQVFINMISDKYDTQYRESMWEVEFMGDRRSSEDWSNGYIGSYLGMRSNISEDYDKANCNYAQGYYNGSLQLWNLYWATDRTQEEHQLISEITDVRQDWNMAPYNYVGNSTYAPYPNASNGKCVAGIDKAPYTYGGNNTSFSVTNARAIRNCSKFRRETEYEGISGFKSTGTGINFPLLRYSDVLLMYAEAYNEYYGTPTEEVFGYVKMVRDRAGIQTKDYSENYSDYSHFQSLVRNERGRELVFEGIRKYDLIRWGIFVSEMEKYSQYADDQLWASSSTSTSAARLGNNVQPRHIYYPIPTRELGVNLELQQNPLWR